MKMRASNKVLIKVERYFMLNAVSSSSRRTLDDLQSALGINKRILRAAISQLNLMQVPIIPDTKNGGYFVVDRHNQHDMELLEIYLNRQKSKSSELRKRIESFNFLYPDGQLNLGY
jgi:ABC-type bacteriocin/lantibiotic exporter with double-glycine peptidase domain